MCGRMCLLVALAVAMSLGTAYGAVDPDIIGWWWFDEGGGTTAADSSGNGNNGTLMGGASWAPGYFRTALQLDGVDGYVEVPHDASLLVDDEATVMAWVNTPRLETTSGGGYQGIIGKGNGTARSYSLYTTPSNLHFSTGPANAYIGSSSSTGAIPTNEWVHVCGMIINDGHQYYVNGEDAGTFANGAVGPGAADTENLVIGRTQEGTGRSFEGLIDDVRIYRRGLTQEEVQRIMTGSDLTSTAAGNPLPGDAQQDVRRDVVLSWTPGEYAATHDVYFGTIADDVNNASRTNPMGVLVSQGQAASSYDPAGLLDIAQTYYWRIDEVNAPPSNTIFKGSLWSFTTEPLAYPIAGITATSNGLFDATAAPENTVNGSGLNENDEHSLAPAAMWLTKAPEDGSDLYIQYEFDNVYKLHELLVWNYNVQFELLLGFGVKDVTVEYSVDGEEWATLGDFVLAQATAKATYVANTTVNFDGVAARYVRLNINSGHSTMGQYGLSEVRFTYIPVQAREPQPSDGAANVDPGSVLAWRPGREAVSHEVYVGTNAEDLMLAGTAAQPTFTPADLVYGGTYYWQVVEVNPDEAISAWAGNVWSFSTSAYAVVDDMESYTDDIDAGEAIFDTWLDGWVNNTGSTVGYLQTPFAERTIVHGGRQAMPLFYENTGGATVAEAERRFETPQDWTARGLKSLSLYFYGTAGNTGQFYVKINNTKVPYDGDATDITRGAWQVWNIDLASVGATLSSVTSLTIGIDGAGATGTLYIDDVRLYPNVPEFVTPTEPGTESLVARYAFDGNANDGSGHGYNGTVQGSPTYVAGKDGQAIALDGVRQYVVVESVGITGAAPRTIAGWAKADTTSITAWANVFGFTGPTGNGGHFDIEAVGDSGTNATLGYYGLHRYGWEFNILPIDLEWHHLAASFDGTTVRWYGDGMLVGSDDVDNVNTPGPFHVGKRQDNEVFFPGAVDEVRVYSEALADGEIAWLAGKRVPMHKPF